MADLVESPIGTIPTIAIDTGGFFTPGAAYAIKLNADLVNGIWELANTKATDFDAKIDDLTNATTGWLINNQVGDITAGSITAASPTEPSMTIADTSTALVVNDFNSAASAIVSALYSDRKSTRLNSSH